MRWLVGPLLRAEQQPSSCREERDPQGQPDRPGSVASGQVSVASLSPSESKKEWHHRPQNQPVDNKGCCRGHPAIIHLKAETFADQRHAQNENDDLNELP